LDVGADLLDPRRPDEDRAHRLVAGIDLEIRLEARDLPPERVAADDDVRQAEMVAVEEDHSGAGAEERPLEAAERLVEAVEPGEPHDRGRLAAGNHEPVETAELLGLAHLDGFRTEDAQHRRVLAEVALQGEN